MRFMVFDVESVGLHGEGFAVGWVVVDGDGNEYSGDSICCPLEAAQGPDEGRAWVTEHVLPHLGPAFLETPQRVRDTFWWHWMHERALGAVLVADCPWPVEARFLAACIEDDPVNRTEYGPYPLIDVASVRLAKGLDPLGTDVRFSRELPAHNPEADARQSARLLIEALGRN